jgi:tRNA-specific 2-thiouridylase
MKNRSMPCALLARMICSRSSGVRLRYRGPLRPGRIVAHDNGRMRLRFESPAESAAPGQSAVLYRDDEVVGGGIIESKLSLDELS